MFVSIILKTLLIVTIITYYCTCHTDGQCVNIDTFNRADKDLVTVFIVVCIITIIIINLQL